MGHGRDSSHSDKELLVSRRTGSIDPGTIVGTVARLTGRDAIGPPRFIPRGLANEGWVVDTSVGPVMVKVGKPNASTAKMASSHLAVDMARSAGVPTPRLLSFAHSFPLLGGRAVRVFEYLPGEGLGTANLAEIPPRVWEDCGHAVKRLHGVAMPWFSSRLDGTAPTFASWGAYLEHRGPQILGRLVDSPFVDARPFKALLDAAVGLAHRLSPGISATLVHRDLHPDNLVACGDRLVAVLDFDQAEAWEPVADFLKLEWLVFDDAPQARAPFMKAYGGSSDQHPNFHERLHIAGIMEYTNTLAGLDPDEEHCVYGLMSRLTTIAAEEGWRVP